MKEKLEKLKSKIEKRIGESEEKESKSRGQGDWLGAFCYQVIKEVLTEIKNDIDEILSDKI